MELDSCWQSPLPGSTTSSPCRRAKGVARSCFTIKLSQLGGDGGRGEHSIGAAHSDPKREALLHPPGSEEMLRGCSCPHSASLFLAFSTPTCSAQMVQMFLAPRTQRLPPLPAVVWVLVEL